MQQPIFKIFQKLQKESTGKSDGFNIAALPLVKNHRIGVSSSGLPMFFIQCDNSTNLKSLDSNLEFIAVQYNRQCQLISHKNEISEGVYTIISLKTYSIDLQAYFLEVIFLVINKLSALPNLKELKIEVEKLTNLFNKFSNAPTKTTQGLWAELLVIEQSSNPDYLIQSWHNSEQDKFDFNDGVDKAEVKSTAKSRRIHNFAIEQLHTNKNSNLVIISVFAVQTGLGTNIFDLIGLIEKKVKDASLSFRINEIVAQTLGNELEKAFGIFYDYQLAKDTIQYYASESVPRINSKNIPREVLNIKFDSDLTDILPLQNMKTKSTLHNSLFQK